MHKKSTRKRPKVASGTHIPAAHFTQRAPKQPPPRGRAWPPTTAIKRLSPVRSKRLDTEEYCIGILAYCITYTYVLGHTVLVCGSQSAGTNTL